MEHPTYFAFFNSTSPTTFTLLNIHFILHRFGDLKFFENFDDCNAVEKLYYPLK